MQDLGRDLFNERVNSLPDNVTGSELQMLLSVFHPVILSRRVESHIKGVRDLVSILEARNVLKTSDMSVLDEMERVLMVGRNNNRSISDCQQSSSLQSVLPPICSRPVAQSSDVLMQVVELVEDGCGRDWRSFARSLSVPEAAIDKISFQYGRSDTKGATKKVIQLHLAQCSKDHIECIIVALKNIVKQGLLSEVLRLSGRQT